MASNNKMLDRVQISVLTTLLYHDIFDFPLKRDELWNLLISKEVIKEHEFAGAVNYLKKKYIIEENGYYALKKRAYLIDIRRNNLNFVKKKLKIARIATKFISLIPTVKLIGLSGGLAIGDANRNDDIDFFIITEKNSIFKTRLFIIIILQLLGLRRRRIDKNPSDKICVNLLIDETRMLFPTEDRDLYVAHEIGQLVPLFERDNSYLKFLNKNSWIRNFLPNIRTVAKGRIEVENNNILIKILINLAMNLFNERICSVLQLVIISKHKTTEIITQNVLAFNPNDYRVKTLENLRLKLLEIGLLTRK